MISVTQMSDRHILRVGFLSCYVFILKTAVSSIICLSAPCKTLKRKREFWLNDYVPSAYLQELADTEDNVK